MAYPASAAAYDKATVSAQSEFGALQYQMIEPSASAA
jgi:hypothetical protein